ncbi:MAG: AmmeMemoRadiSam system protein A [Phycisphaerae bacterium]|nr:AmmeMemoRadiSam system protein A [Phycisphaerae bacterium]
MSECPQLDQHAGRMLLRIARREIEAAVRGISHTLEDAGTSGEESPSSLAAFCRWAAAIPHAGVFVTLRTFGRLRGCIGTFSDEADLVSTIIEMARASLSDPRFHAMRITESELADLGIEVSILSPRTRLTDPLQFELGRDGIYIKSGSRAGCFLPDVATDAGWNREQFLSALCREKAHLSPDAWRDPDTEVYAFTVRKFRE